MSNFSVLNIVIVTTGSVTATSNIAGWFDEHQSMVTLSISAISCLAFVVSLSWQGWLKWDERKRQIKKTNPES